MNETAPVSAPSIPDEPGVVSPDLYPLADALMRFRRQDCVIDIGCQDVERLGRLPARRTIGLCSGAHLQKSRTLLPEAEWLEADLGLDVEAGLELAERLPANAVVLCAALAGDGGPPAGLAALIKALLQRGGAVIACSTIAGTSGDGGLDGRRKAADQVAALINAGLPVTAYSLSPGDPGSRGGGVLISLHDGAAPEDLAPAAEGLAFDDLSHLILGLGEFTHFSEPDPPASHTASPLRPLLPALVRAQAQRRGRRPHRDVGDPAPTGNRGRQAGPPPDGAFLRPPRLDPDGSGLSGTGGRKGLRPPDPATERRGPVRAAQIHHRYPVLARGT